MWRSLDGAGVCLLARDPKGAAWMHCCGESRSVRVTVASPLFQENERTRDLIIEQRFHRTIIGQKGERIREIRDKFPEVTVSSVPLPPGEIRVALGSGRCLEFLPVTELGLLICPRSSSTSQTQPRRVTLSSSEGPRTRWRSAQSTCRRWWQTW